MKILVTGGLGFIGSHLCDSLVTNNHDVIIISKNLDKKQNISNIEQNIHTELIDVTDYNSLQHCIIKHSPDVIFHLAGQTSHKKSFENPIYDIDVNAKSTLCILDTIKNHSMKCKFILGSTFIVVGKPLSLPVTEQSYCNPTTIYGVNRLLSEHYNTIYRNVHGLDTITFRITNSFGPREQYLTTKNAINFLIYQAFKNKKINIYDNGQFFRDIIYITDVVSALQVIMNKGNDGLYWISSGKKTWFYELGRLLEELTGSKVEYIPSPDYVKKTDVGNFIVDNSKLKSLGWKPNIELKKGLELTLDYFKSYNL